jgi:hypothetical protein
VDYNLSLGARMARMTAAALNDAGIPDSRIADPPSSDLGVGCSRSARAWRRAGMRALKETASASAGPRHAEAR